MREHYFWTTESTFWWMFCIRSTSWGAFTVRICDWHETIKEKSKISNLDTPNPHPTKTHTKKKANQNKSEREREKLKRKVKLPLDDDTESVLELPGWLISFPWFSSWARLEEVPFSSASAYNWVNNYIQNR